MNANNNSQKISKIFKKPLALTLALLMCLSLVSVFTPMQKVEAAASSGTYYGMSWSLAADGTLTLSGTYNNSNSQGTKWDASSVKKVVTSGTVYLYGKNGANGTNSSNSSARNGGSGTAPDTYLFSGHTNLTTVNGNFYFVGGNGGNAGTYTSGSSTSTGTSGSGANLNLQLFHGCTNLTSVSGNITAVSGANGSGASNVAGSFINANNIFYNCKNLTDVNVNFVFQARNASGYNCTMNDSAPTINGGYVDASSMFTTCTNLKNLGGSFDFKSGNGAPGGTYTFITTTHYDGGNGGNITFPTFTNNKSLISVNISKYNLAYGAGGTGGNKNGTTYSNKNFNSMFSGCTNLTTVNNFVSCATSVKEIFKGCTNLTTVNGFTSNSTTDMSYAFSGCTKLTSQSKNIVAKGDCSYMFNGCTSLTTAPTMNTAGVTNMSHMFEGCSGMIEPNFQSFDTSNVTNMSYMFNGCSNITDINIYNFNTAKVTDMSYMFKNCKKINDFDLSSFNTGNVTTMKGMFEGCARLEDVPAESWFNTSKVTDMSYMFNGCSSMKHVPLKLNTSAVTTMAYMFNNCSKLNEPDLNDFNSLKVTNMSYMFNGCSGMKKIDVSPLETDAVTTMQNMFSNCSSLTDIDLSSDIGNFNTSKVVTMASMFANDTSLENLDTTIFNTPALTTVNNMFDGCSNLYNLNISSMDTSKVTSGYNNMLTGATNLSQIVTPAVISQDRILTLPHKLYDDEGKAHTVISLTNTLLSVSRIIYHLNGGTANNPSTYQPTDETFTLENPTRDGAIFLGWTGTGYDELTKEVVIPEGSIGNREYTAHWQTVPYTISYDLDYGTLSESNPTEYTVETGDIILHNPTKVGHKFLGWTGTGLEEPTKDVVIPANSYGDREYTANWEVENYNIKYNLNGGVTNNPTSYTVYSADIVLSEPVREGFTFVGWTGTDIDEPTKDVVIPSGSTQNKEYTANWEIINYSISYNLYGGEAANPTKYTVINYDILLNNPTRQGYTFVGWTGTGLTEPTLTVTIPSGSTQNRIYIANWALEEYTIGYNLNGGTGENITAYNINTADIKLTAPTKDGYNFIGWSGNGLAELTKEVTIPKGSVGNREYTAHWEVADYALNYNLNGGEAVNPTMYTILNSDITLNNPTKKGYTFTGWTGMGITEPAINVTIPQGSTGNRTYNANYSLMDYTISYDLAGGKANNITGYNVTSDDITLNAPTRIGYDFIGWSGTDLDDLTMEVVIPTGSIGDRSYTAHYQLKDGCSTGTYYGLTWIKDAEGNVAILEGEATDEEGESWGDDITSITTEGTVVLNDEIANGMFKDQDKLVTVDVSDFDLSNVTDLSSMFEGCTSLNTVYGIESLDTSNVESMSSMFKGCESLTTLDLSNFDTSKVTDMSSMFEGAKATTINVSGFDISNVEDRDNIFKDCDATSLKASDWELGDTTSLSSMFEGCAATNIDITGWDTENVTDMSSMFEGCENLETVEGISTLNTTNTENISSMFKDCGSIGTLDLSNWDTAKVEDMSSAFENTKATEINVQNWDISSVEDRNNVFKNCETDKLDTTNWNVTQQTDLSSMFEDCGASSIVVDGWDTSNATNISDMFSGCTNLEEIKGINELDTSNVENTSGAFKDCENLKDLDLSGWDTTNTTDVTDMFSGCSSLENLDISGFDMSNVEDSEGLLDGCDNLNNVTMPEELGAVEIPLVAPSKEGYTFLGWTAEGSDEMLTEVIITSENANVVYTPHFRTKTVKLDDGSGELKTINLSRDKNQLLPTEVEPPVTEGNKVFKGYFDINGTQYFDKLGNNIKNWDKIDTNEEDEILYARFERVEETKPEPAPAPITPSRAGHTFNGWVNEETNTNVGTELGTAVKNETFVASYS